MVQTCWRQRVSPQGIAALAAQVGVAALQSGRDAIFGAFPFSFAEVEWSTPLRSQRDFQPPYQLHFIFLAIIHPFLSFHLLEKQKIYQ